MTASGTLRQLAQFQRHVWSWVKTGSNRTTVKMALMTLAVWKLHTPTSEENDLSLNEQLAIRRAIAAGLKWAWREVHSIAVTPR
jgi:hypothetical protein